MNVSKLALQRVSGQHVLLAVYGPPSGSVFILEVIVNI
jgi:hypothetical protein